MCEVCKTDQKCAHPWAQCMASRGEHCAACGHTSWAPRRHRPYATDVSESPKGQPQEGGPSPSGEDRASRQPPGDCIAYVVHLAPVIAVMVMMPTTAADRHRHKDAGVSTDRNR